MFAHLVAPSLSTNDAFDISISLMASLTSSFSTTSAKRKRAWKETKQDEYYHKCKHNKIIIITYVKKSFPKSSVSSLTKAVASRSKASNVLADVNVVSLLVLASFRISTYTLTM